MHSIDVIKEIVQRHSDIKTCRFFSFSTTTKVQDRLTDIKEDEKRLISKAQARKKIDRSRFWSAVLSTFIDEKNHSDKMLNEVFYHQPNRDYTYVDRGRIEAFLQEKGGAPRALNSKVLLNNGATRHIPLLDFKVPSKDGHDELVIACMAALKLRGYVLDSGRSYHFIGIDLVSESELVDLLAKFIFLDPIADKAWAAHQILERSASLRISEGRSHAPTVVAQL